MTNDDSGADRDAELKSRLIRSVGTHRTERTLSPVEVGHALDYFATKNSLKAVSDDIHLDPSTAARFLRLLTLPASVKSIVDWGTSKTTISFSAASEIAALGGTADQEHAARLALRHRLTKDELRQAVQVHKRAGTSVEHAIEDVVSRRTTIVTIDVFIGAVPKMMRPRIERLTQHERDALLRKALGTTLPVGAGARMTPSHYTITTSVPLPDELINTLDDLVAERLATLPDA